MYPFRCPLLHSPAGCEYGSSSLGEASIAEGGGPICIAVDTTFCNLSSLPSNQKGGLLSCFYRLPIPDQCFMEGGRRAIRLGAHTPPRGLWLIEFNVSYLICQQEASFVSVDRQCQHCEGLNRYLTFTSDEASFFIHVHFGQRNALETTLMNFVAFSMALHGTAVITLPLLQAPSYHLPSLQCFIHSSNSVFPLNT